MTKAFDKVWHKGLLFKLKSLGITNPLLAWIKSYLTDRKQCVVIDGQASEWSNIEAGVPQGLVLGPLLFLVYINDITTDLETDCFLYADDTSLIDVVDNINSSSAKLNSDLDKIGKWTRDWFVTINPSRQNR